MASDTDLDGVHMEPSFIPRKAKPRHLGSSTPMMKMLTGKELLTCPAQCSAVTVRVSGGKSVLRSQMSLFQAVISLGGRQERSGSHLSILPPWRLPPVLFPLLPVPSSRLSSGLTADRIW